MCQCANKTICQCADVKTKESSQVRSYCFSPAPKFFFLVLLVTCYSLLATAQEERSLTREGNKQFDKQKYADAEASYKKAL